MYCVYVGRVRGESEMAVVRAINEASQWDCRAVGLGVLRPRSTDREPLGIGAGEVLSERCSRPTSWGYAALLESGILY